MADLKDFINGTIVPNPQPAPIIAPGGFVRGNKGIAFVKGPKGKDKVKAMLTHGEAVLPAKAVKKLGPMGVRMAMKGYGAKRMK